ncbi:hypothetical protein AGR2A_Lc30003 [Agrobacterium genomosp. 2 str. CFBP 5494]|uniref:Uncharacterized protein n=1 Tax=Agrobacterium genomosp. 2 str. CFBP 5494 TaxID=1183436 RepID=A0A9W5B482_9HYPH|nr:hypothetical protein AGR2A_Lc30003 [Agrobacterium genomosp. 2 str. CFBP 5494]
MDALVFCQVSRPFLWARSLPFGYGGRKVLRLSKSGPVSERRGHGVAPLLLVRKRSEV